MMKKSFLVPLLLLTSLSGAAMTAQAAAFHLNVPNGSGANSAYLDKTYSVSVYSKDNTYKPITGFAYEDGNGTVISTFGVLPAVDMPSLYFRVDVSAGKPGAYMLKDGDDLQGDYCKVSAVEPPADGATELSITFNPREAPDAWGKCRS